MSWIPADWEAALGALAANFQGFSELELWWMSMERLRFWIDRLEEVQEARAAQER